MRKSAYASAARHLCATERTPQKKPRSVASPNCDPLSGYAPTRSTTRAERRQPVSLGLALIRVPRMDMNDTTAESRAKRLAKELKDLWEKPTTTECLRLPEGGPGAARRYVERKVSDVKPNSKKMQSARRR
jgi:hypothetical protein